TAARSRPPWLRRGIDAAAPLPHRWSPVMHRRFPLFFVLLLVLVSIPVLAGVAGAHSGSVVGVDCTTVHGDFEGFHPEDHPIWFEVSVGGGAFQTVAATEQPPGFVDGSASADISALTAAL